MADDAASATFLAELEVMQGRIDLVVEKIAVGEDNGTIVAGATDNVEDAQRRDPDASPGTPGASPCAPADTPGASPGTPVRRSCVQCALPVEDKVLAQVRSGDNTVKCHSCNSKNVILHRMFGQWPIDDFKNSTRRGVRHFGGSRFRKKSTFSRK